MDGVYKQVQDTYNSRDWNKNILGSIHVETVAANSANAKLINTVRRELEDSQFTIKEATEYISSCRYHTTVYNSLPNNIKGPVTINVFTEKVADLPPILLLHRVFKRIVATISILSIHKNKRFVFWLVPCDKNRWFPKSGVVKPQHINGGFTYITNDSTETVNIFIYRLEEFPKVMLHETIHHSSKDFHGLIQENDVRRLKQLCRIHNDTVFLPNEAIVETWAIIMQLSFLSVEYDISYVKLLDKEKVWSDKQAKRMLTYQYRGNDTLWKEETNSYCYIVLKSRCLHDVDGFIRSSKDTKRMMDFMTKVAETISTLKVRVQHVDSHSHTEKKKQETLPDCFRMSVFGSI